MKNLIYTATICIVISACGNANSNKKTAEANNNTSPNTEANQALAIPAEVEMLMQKNTCSACHALNDRTVGPSYIEIAKRKYTPEKIVALIYKPEPSNWPEYSMPMIAMPNVPEEEALKIAQWIKSIE